MVHILTLIYGMRVALLPVPKPCSRKLFCYCNRRSRLFKVETITINSSSSLTTQTSFVQPTCGLENGSAGITVSGGTLPYSYLWNEGSTTPGISNLAPGNYSVTVTDAAACSKSETITINSSSSITTNFFCSTNLWD